MAKRKDYLYYYGATGFSKAKSKKVWIGIYAHDDAEAEIRYRECIARHDELEALANPGICQGGGDDELYTQESLDELEKFNSALII